MKRVIFLLFAVFSVIGACYYLVCNKPDDEGFNIHSFFGFSNDTGILPVSEWQENLVGRWQFEMVEKGTKIIFQTVGENFYKENGEFTNYYSVKIYEWNNNYTNDAPIIDPRCLRATMGGSFSGIWEMDTLKRCWREYVNTTLLGNNPVIDPGYEEYIKIVWFDKNDTLIRGEVESNFTKIHTKIFSHNSVLFEGKDYSDGFEISQKYIRLIE